jgi:hypothetical protein
MGELNRLQLANFSTHETILCPTAPFPKLRQTNDENESPPCWESASGECWNNNEKICRTLA